MLRRFLKELHWPLVLSALSLMIFGTLFIYSASYHDSGHYLDRQLFWVSIAAGMMFVIPAMGYRAFLSMANLLYVLAVIALVLVLLVGQERLGAQRGIRIGPGIVQPSEFAKLATVLMLANYLGSHQEWDKRGKVIFTAITLGLIPVFLIMKQPDLGSSLLFLPMVMMLLYVWGLSYKSILAAALSGIVAVPFLWLYLKPYQKRRILDFMDPSRDPLGSGYTAIQSKIAVGSGGFFGKGYLHGTQSQLQFVPEHHTDFIFCVIGEEAGYLGSVLLLFLYGWLFYAAFQIMEKTTDIKAKLLITGLITVLFFQVFINIGMSFGLMPITGITLPLVSYGGSSLIATTITIGLILSVYKERSIF